MSAHPPTQTCSLTGVKEDHGLETNVLLPLQIELSDSGRGSDQHVEDLHEALDTTALLSATHRHRGWEEHVRGSVDQAAHVSAHKP